MKAFAFSTALFLASLPATFAQPAKITVSMDHPAHPIPETLWGIFFEDINLSADGGIYPELVRNRSFEDSDQPDDWKITGAEGTIEDASPLNPFNRHYLRLKVDGPFTLENEGYWGMNVVRGDAYKFRLAARSAEKAGFDGALTVRLLGAEGHELAKAELPGKISSAWQYQQLDLVPEATDAKAKLEISGGGKGILLLDMVSLLPKKTWKNHGLRVDLAEALDGLHPKFLRFPGGCWVEGDDFAHMNHWKNTIGDIDTRTPLWNFWKYFATQGMGYYEYLQLAEDLGAEPLFCINVGMSHHETVPLDRIGQWVQDALDAIEYANGPTNSVWGALRAKAGHPAPFHLKYMEIGNENGGEAYRERWPLFVQAIHAKYPEMKLIADDWAGSYPKTPAPEIIDQHFYNNPDWFLRQARHFDNYDRKGPKIFVGEYAVTANCGLGNLRGAIAEAAFMTGLERNSDQVVMASYAPLLVNLNHRAWNPDLINFDSSKWYGLPGYYVQQLFAENRGDFSLPARVEIAAVEPEIPGGRIGVGTWRTAAEFKDVKVTGNNGEVLFASDFSNGTGDWTLLGEGADWKARDGALRQNAEKEFIRALAGNRAWRDYTLTLKARKISGAEGFLILFHIGGDEDRTWWNLGGWGNTRDGIEAGDILDSKPETIETGPWYDLKLVTAGRHLKCYVDGKLVHDLDLPPAGKIDGLYAAAARDAKTGDTILKVVNAGQSALETEIKLAGGKKLSGHATATVLTSASPEDENSLEHPTRVSPKSEAFSFSGTTLKRDFPANSLTVLRLAPRK